MTRAPIARAPPRAPHPSVKAALVGRSIALVLTPEQKRREARERRLAAERAADQADARRRRRRDIVLVVLALAAVPAVFLGVLALGAAIGGALVALVALVGIAVWVGRKPNRSGEQAQETVGTSSFTGH